MTPDDLSPATAAARQAHFEREAHIARAAERIAQLLGLKLTVQQRALLSGYATTCDEQARFGAYQLEIERDEAARTRERLWRASAEAGARAAVEAFHDVSLGVRRQAKPKRRALLARLPLFRALSKRRASLRAIAASVAAEESARAYRSEQGGRRRDR